jgi:cytoskeleton protein RodZ
MPTEETISKSGIEDNVVVANESLAVGSLLRQERMRRGFSENEVAEKLHITRHYVRSIETGLFEKLPSAIFVKGYIKSYAILLGVNVDEVISLYDEYVDQLKARKDGEGLLQARIKKDRNRLWLIVSALVFVAGFAGLWVADKYSDEEVIVTSEEVSASLEIIQTVVSRTPPSTTSAELDLNLVLETGDNALSSSVDTTRTVILATAMDVGSFSKDKLIAIGMAGDDLLRITFAGESWIEVNDSEGNQIYRDIRVDGDILEIRGKAPFGVLLGDAPFITLSLNGNEIDVLSDIRIDNSARITVGL